MILGNPLGDARAEHDLKMLEKGFWETNDYKSLVSSLDRPVVVGRRGTGKSALMLKLAEYYRSAPKTSVLEFTPEEDQVIGFREVIKKIDSGFSPRKAASKISWKFAVLVEVCRFLSSHYKYGKYFASGRFRDIIAQRESQGSLVKFTRKYVSDVQKKYDSSQTFIAELSDELKISEIQRFVLDCLNDSGAKIVFLADRLDDGYQPDELGVSIVDGFVQAVIELNDAFSGRISAVAFVRDNIYRAIARHDPDFTRDIEGKTLRLHWDEYNLFNLVCIRLREAFSVDIENNTRLWNRFAARELEGAEGFRQALRLTLYRPRDILVLLNGAFLRAAGDGREKIVPDDINSSAMQISQNRIADLHKEYQTIFPSLDEFTGAFSGGTPELTVLQAERTVSSVMASGDNIDKVRDKSFFETPRQVIHNLYSVGFLGVYHDQTSSFVFCHDGKQPDRVIADSSRLLVHPCYWLALGLQETAIKQQQAEDINDEYDIQVTSAEELQRGQSIGALISKLGTIPEGRGGAKEFEEWCIRVVKILFSGPLTNVELHPNKNGLQQRDIVATNMGGVPVWNRIVSDYGTRQVIFEIKNYKEVTPEDYRQISVYLNRDYGKLAFVITRDHKEELEKVRELRWVRELYNNERKVVVKLSAKFLERHLSKSRKPQKHDAVNTDLSKLIDIYVRQYFGERAR